MLKKPTFSFSEISKELESNHIYTRKQIDNNIFHKFSRFGYLDVYNNNSVTREYLFFTKMDLHLFQPHSNTLNPEIAGIPFFTNCNSRYRDTMNQLQWSNRYATSNSPFCNLLSNTVRSNLDLSDISIDKMESAANIKGVRLEYPLPTVNSSNLQEFSLEFEDNKFLDVYMFFRIWYEYELLKLNGQVSPPYQSYITNKILHDQMSVYKIVVGEDLETIIHWSKFWGVYPQNIPRSIFSDNIDGPIKFSVNFMSQWAEDMDPNILADFNILVGPKKNLHNKTIPIFNNSISMVNGEWCNVPYITTDNINNRTVYKLKWR